MVSWELLLSEALESKEERNNYNQTARSYVLGPVSRSGAAQMHTDMQRNEHRTATAPARRELVTLEVPRRGALRAVLPQDCPQEVADAIDACMQVRPALHLWYCSGTASVL